MSEQVLVIGGGASGLMAAIWAARYGASVTVLDANEKPGRKLLATGGGRCNLTNLNWDADCWFGPERERAAQIVSHFPPEEIVRFFREMGLETTDVDGWVYPRSMQASTVLEVLLLEISSLKIKIKTNERVISLTRGIGQDGRSVFTAHTATWQYTAGSVVLACGSPASQVRGSYGDLQTLTSNFLLQAEPFRPALVPLHTEGRFMSRWMGQRVKAGVTLLIGGRRVMTEEGEVQLTENGISGIPVFQISGPAVLALAQGRRVEAELDFYPEGTDEELAGLLFSRMSDRPFKTVRQSLVGLLPEKLIPLFTDASSSIDLRNTAVDSLMPVLEQTAARIRHFRVGISQSGPVDKAQVCQGGVPLSALQETLEASDCPGLFIAGEAADVYGRCGGYNLTWAWASGYTAGISAAWRGKKR